eukprot:CAMPEP_0194541408 /NCGR_PEP_ID=MMETSP0253-20130528/82143_1 /TAXON_ID=2966 /ORGANISM="Noctiluca scintillans" /LENGTH=108 /DNA_ID=CAMNT_0039387893 /DNA_START=36 /DNA_END=359 /DNA_ORIENTATION=+
MDGEALSRARLLAVMLQMNMPLTVGHLHHTRDIEDLNTKVLEYIIVSLTANSLSSKEFVGTLLEMRRLCGKAKILLLKSSDFQFPTVDVVTRSLCPQWAAVLSVDEKE